MLFKNLRTSFFFRFPQQVALRPFQIKVLRPQSGKSSKIVRGKPVRFKRPMNQVKDHISSRGCKDAHKEGPSIMSHSHSCLPSSSDLYLYRFVLPCCSGSSQSICSKDQGRWLMHLFLSLDAFCPFCVKTQYIYANGLPMLACLAEQVEGVTNI